MCNLFLSRALAIVALALLAACSPDLNWREMAAADGAVRVAFPARPHAETRELPVGGEMLPFTLNAAVANDAVFAVGHLRLPADAVRDPTLRARYVEAMETSLTRNLQAGGAERREVEVMHVAGGARPAVRADEIEVRGEPNGEPAWLLARILVVGDRLVEVAAVGTQASLTPEAARTFVESVRVQ